VAMGVVPEGAGRDLTSYSSGGERILCKSRVFAFPQDGSFVGDTETAPYAAPMLPVYWNTTDNEATPADGGGLHPFLGFLVRAKDDDVVFVDVRPGNAALAGAVAASGYAPVRGVVASNIADLAAFTVAG